MKYEQPAPEDMADLLHHRATLPAAIWALLLVAACVSSLLEKSAMPQAPVSTRCATPTQAATQRPVFEPRRQDTRQAKQQWRRPSC
jgi:hypothetical protein